MLSKNNKILKPLLLTMFLIMLSEMSFSQSQSVSKKAVKNFEKACSEFFNDKSKALTYAEKALKSNKYGL